MSPDIQLQHVSSDVLGGVARLCVRVCVGRGGGGIMMSHAHGSHDLLQKNSFNSQNVRRKANYAENIVSALGSYKVL